MSDPLDQQTAVAGIRWARELASQPALAQYIEHELEPGEALQSDEEILEFARETGGTIYHPVGTCKMGIDGDANAVVEATLRVRGVERLRVIDASVMPRLVSGNTNAPTIAIAEKACDMIRADAKQKVTA